MADTKHTPGPWEVLGVLVDGDPHPEIVIGAKAAHRFLTVAVAIGGLETQQGNALLLAASPELKDALKGLIPYAAQWINDCHPAMKKAKAALAKAEGSAA